MKNVKKLLLFFPHYIIIWNNTDKLLYTILISATTGYSDPVCFRKLMQNFLTYKHFVSSSLKCCSLFSKAGDRMHSEC